MAKRFPSFEELVRANRRNMMLEQARVDSFQRDQESNRLDKQRAEKVIDDPAEKIPGIDTVEEVIVETMPVETLSQSQKNAREEVIHEEVGAVLSMQQDQNPAGPDSSEAGQLAALRVEVNHVRENFQLVCLDELKNLKKDISAVTQDVRELYKNSDWSIKQIYRLSEAMDSSLKRQHLEYSNVSGHLDSLEELRRLDRIEPEKNKIRMEGFQECAMLLARRGLLKRGCLNDQIFLGMLNDRDGFKLMYARATATLWKPTQNKNPN